MVFDNDTHMVVVRKGDHKPLNVGTMLFISDTRVPFGRVVGYYFGSVTKPDYVVRLDSDKVPLGTPITFVGESAQHIDEEDLYKRFHDPVKNEFDFFDEEEEEEEAEDDQIDVQYQHFKSCQSTEPDHGQDNFNPSFYMPSYQPMMYQIPQTNPHNQMGINVPNLLHSQAPMMYQPEQPFMRPETYQQNQMGIVPNLFPNQAPMMPMMYQPEQPFMRPETYQQVPSLAPIMPMMYQPQQHNFRSSQIIEPNRGAQGSTLFAGQSYFNQPFGMQQQPSLNTEAPMMYNQQDSFIRPETDQQNRMGFIPNQALTMIIADLVMHLQQYSNQQQFGLPQPRPEVNFNAQTQHTMQSQVFNHGSSSSYRGRGGGRG